MSEQISLIDDAELPPEAETEDAGTEKFEYSVPVESRVEGHKVIITADLATVVAAGAVGGSSAVAALCKPGKKTIAHGGGNVKGRDAKVRQLIAPRYREDGTPVLTDGITGAELPPGTTKGSDGRPGTQARVVLGTMTYGLNLFFKPGK